MSTETVVCDVCEREIPKHTATAITGIGYMCPDGVQPPCKSTLMANVPVFTFELVFTRDKIPTNLYLCGVQNAKHGTFSDFFASKEQGIEWVKDVLVAYFGYSASFADALTEDAVEDAIERGWLAPS